MAVTLPDCSGRSGRVRRPWRDAGPPRAVEEEVTMLAEASSGSTEAFPLRCLAGRRRTPDASTRVGHLRIAPEDAEPSRSAG